MTIDAPNPGDRGYWTFMSMAIVILFVFYIAGRGELAQWITILVPNPGAVPKALGAAQQPSTGGDPLNAPANAVQGNTTTAPNASKVAGPTTGPTAPINPL